MILDLNRRLVFTARTSTDLRIISWVSLQIVSLSCLQRTQSISPVTESGSFERIRSHCDTQPYIERGELTHASHMYVTVHTHARVLPHTSIHTGTCKHFIYTNPHIHVLSYNNTPNCIYIIHLHVFIHSHLH